MPAAHLPPWHPANMSPSVLLVLWGRAYGWGLFCDWAGHGAGEDFTVAGAISCCWGWVMLGRLCVAERMRML